MHDEFWIRRMLKMSNNRDCSDDDDDDTFVTVGTPLPTYDEG